MSRIDDLNPRERAELEAWAGRLADDAQQDHSDARRLERMPIILELQQARFQRAYAERHVAEVVAQARTEGLSWHKVGLALGTTGEAARQRYGQLTNA